MTDVRRTAPLRWLVRPILMVLVVYPLAILGALLAPVVRASAYFALVALPCDGFGGWLRRRQIKEPKIFVGGIRVQ